MISYFTSKSIINYSPFQMTFLVNAGIKIENIQIGYEHSCYHPLQPYITFFKYEVIPKYEGSYNRFFIRIKAK